MSSRGIELQLPDLPEVPIQLGAVADDRPRPGAVTLPLGARLREALASYLPLLLMAVLALGTWWIVKNAPRPLPPPVQSAPRTDPDYTMSGFTVQRFASDGRLRVRIQGRQLRHLPDADRIEIDDVTIRAYAADGREAVATARLARADGRATEIELLGGARVRTRTPDGTAVDIDSEFLHAFLDTERVQTHLPVRVRFGANEMRAGGLTFDNRTRQLELQGPMRGRFEPSASSPADPG